MIPTQDGLTMSSLDWSETYEQLDPAGMRGLIAGLAEQARTAWDTGQRCPLPSSFEKPDRVVMLGMGGSAIGGDIIAGLASLTTALPVQLVRGYSLPPVDRRTLVIATSHSGETEETLAAFAEALDGPAMCLAITSGGTLARMAEFHGDPVVRYDFAGMPRAAIGWGVFLPLAILQRLGVLQVSDAMVEASLSGLERSASEWGTERPFAGNLAKQIATGLQGRTPLIVGPHFLEVAARRWAAQVNENAKQWAFYVGLPEANHNLIVAFAHRSLVQAGLRVLVLDSPLLDDRNRLRVRLTANALGAAYIPNDQLLIEGSNVLDVILQAAYLGDWVSLYLAMLGRTNPTPVEPIDQLKAALAQQG